MFARGQEKCLFPKMRLTGTFSRAAEGGLKILALSLSLLACGAAVAGTEYIWKSETGGDMMLGSNWEREGMPEGAADARLTIWRTQSAPITLSESLVCRGGNHYINFTGEWSFATPETTLTLDGGYCYLNGNPSTTWLTRGKLVNKWGTYFESGNEPTRFIVSGSDAAVELNGLTVGSWQQNKSFEVESGATLTVHGDMTVGRDAWGAWNDTFKVTGEGSVATMSGTLFVNSGGNNVAEISDGASLTATGGVQIGEWRCGSDHYVETNVFATGNKVLVDGGSVTTKGPVTVGYHTCSNSLEVINGGMFTVLHNAFHLAQPNTGVGGLIPGIYPTLNYRLNGNRVLVSGQGSLLKIEGGSNEGFWVGSGIGDDSRVDIVDGGCWESSGEFKMGDGGCTNCVFRVGPGGSFSHSVHGVAIGIGSLSSGMCLEVDGGTGTVTAVTTGVGGGGKNARLDVKNGGRFLGAGLEIARDNTSSNCVANVASGAVAEFLGGVDVGLGGVDAAIVVDGGTFIATNGNVKASPWWRENRVGARLVVCNGGTAKIKDMYWGDQGNANLDCGIVVSNGTLEVSGSLNLGGSDGAQMHGCWMTVGGESDSVAVGDQLRVNHDSTLGFDVPANGFARTPVQARWIQFGTQYATRPTLKVRCSPRNQVGYVTLAETRDGIGDLNGVNLDLPKGARLLTAEDPRYDAKKLIVKLPVCGFMVTIR